MSKSVNKNIKKASDTIEENIKINEINEHNIDYDKFEELIDNVDAKVEILTYILLKIANKLCTKNDDSFSFDLTIETKENTDYVMSWFDIIQKLSPMKNTAYISKCQKVVYTIIKHLCKSLNESNIILVTKRFNIQKNDKEKTTKSIHFINGII